MSSIQEQLKAKKKSGSLDKLTSGFDVDTGYVADIVNEAAFMPRKIAFDALKVSPFNTYEFDENEVEELAESILRLGMLDYLIVEMKATDSYEILSGQKRFMAISKIRQDSQENFEKVFPGGKIPCRVIDYDKLELFGTGSPYAISNDTKRTFIIAAGNQQHEKTVKDYMLQVEQLSAVYNELKEKGLVAGQRKREFVAEHTNIQSRSAQKVINARQNLMPELWDALKNCRELTSVTMLEKISELSYDEQNYLLVSILAKQPEAIAAALKLEEKPKKEKEAQEKRDFEPAPFSSNELKALFRIDELYRIADEMPDDVPVTGNDIAKLNEIGSKIEKLQKNADRILKKYRKKKKK